MLALLIQIIIVNCDQRLSTLNYSFNKKKLLHPLMIICCCVIMMLRNNFLGNSLSVVIDVSMLCVCLYLAKQIPRYFRVIKTYAEDKKLIK